MVFGWGEKEMPVEVTLSSHLGIVEVIRLNFMLLWSWNYVHIILSTKYRHYNIIVEFILKNGIKGRINIEEIPNLSNVLL